MLMKQTCTYGCVATYEKYDLCWIFLEDSTLMSLAGFSRFLKYTDIHSVADFVTYFVTLLPI